MGWACLWLSHLWQKSWFCSDLISRNPHLSCFGIKQLLAWTWVPHCPTLTTTSNECQCCWAMNHPPWARCPLLQASTLQWFQNQLHTPERLTYLKVVLRGRGSVIRKEFMGYLPALLRPGAGINKRRSAPAFCPLGAHTPSEKTSRKSNHRCDFEYCSGTHSRAR